MRVMGGSNREANGLLAMLLVGLLGSVGCRRGDAATPGCVTGQSAACACPGDQHGTQVCVAGGTYGPCTCSAPAPVAANAPSGTPTPPTADFTSFTDVKCVAHPGAFHLRPTPTSRSEGTSYPAGTTVGVVSAEGTTTRGRNQLFLVRVPSGTAGYAFLGAHELDPHCPAEIQVHATLAACVGPCRQHYAQNAAPGSMHGGEEDLYADCVTRCGTTVAEYPAPPHPPVYGDSCVAQCAHDYQHGFCHCDDHCSPYEYSYARCLTGCGTTLAANPLPDCPP